MKGKKFYISLEKDNSIVLYTSYDYKYLIQTDDGFKLEENAYICINEDVFALNQVRIRDCSTATIFLDDNQKYYCSGKNILKENLYFTKEG